MPRAYSNIDVKRLIDDHQDLRKKLERVIDLPNVYIDAIKAAADKLVANEVLKILADIPIDALNKEKKGIRIKALLNRGYENIADIASLGTYELASTHGISGDTAFTIRRIVEDIIEDTEKNVKIKLSIDNKTVEATELVRAISGYRMVLAYSEEAKKIQNKNNKQIEYAIEDIKPATGTIRWLFTSRANKKKADEAYSLLKQQIDGDYKQRIDEIALSVDHIDNRMPSEVWGDFQRNPIDFVNILEHFVPGVLGTNDGKYGLPEELLREIQDEAFFPDGLLCELRPYQEIGVKYILHQEKVLLGDEMGLGKTIQAIATMVSLKNTGATHFVIVCPASVIINWCREIGEKSKLRVTKVHGSGRSSAINSWMRTGGVAVTTYETTGAFKLTENFRFSMLVVDEAHYIKNPGAIRSVNVRKLAMHAERMLFMTGTALENKVSEMVELISVLQPDIAFQIKGMEYLSAAPQFRKLVAPVYYRRKREDVLPELPEKTEIKEWCTLDIEEEQIYEQAVLRKHYADARRVSWNVDDIQNSAKARRLMELVQDAEEEGRKVLVFSFFLDTIQKVKELLGRQCLNPINGSITPQRRQEIIDEFDKAPAGTVLAAQIQSGGTGLNIQSASVVIICEPQLKPSIENQAISRVYRMGQVRNVIVYRLLCENTIDEKIVSLLAQKQEIFDAFADKSEAVEQQKQEIDHASFGHLIEEEIKRINAKNNLTKKDVEDI